MSDVFGRTYVEYWKGKAVSQGVPDEDVIRFWIKKLTIVDTDVVLDLGCAHGRLYPLLSVYTDSIVGLDVHNEALSEASTYPYMKLIRGYAEKTGLESIFFDKIISWAVFDVVEQEKALVEENRILKLGGLFLVTGKSKDYNIDDSDAFIAERNAKLKGFPNHFTDVYKLIERSALYGFEVVEAYGFPRRGDLAHLHYFDILAKKRREFYEFLIIFRKVSESQTQVPICSEYSGVALRLAHTYKFQDPFLFFKWHKEKIL